MTTLLSKIGVIGDVHAEDVHLDTILTFLASQQLDQMFCVGDIADGGGSVDRCCELLSSKSVSTVLGNHDQWCLEDSNRRVANATVRASLSSAARSFLESLPRTYIVDTVCGHAMICHGLGDYNMASVRPTDSTEDIYTNLELWALYQDQKLRFVINGHSHRPDLHKFDHLVVINAGSLDELGKACFVVVDFENATVEYYRVNESPRVERCITKCWTGAADPV